MNFLITGTMAYGPVGPNSDLDIVVMYDEVQEIWDFLYEHDIPISTTPGQDSYGDTGGFYFDLAGIKINIIIANNKEEFETWGRRTERMKTIPHIPDRDTRVIVFNEGGGD